uniref:Uncharacterized protein n=1 Tax=Arundo donax TaxID=35708 RepID=A0A0A9BPW5_ARUDO
MPAEAHAAAMRAAAGLLWSTDDSNGGGSLVDGTAARRAPRVRARSESIGKLWIRSKDGQIWSERLRIDGEAGCGRAVSRLATAGSGCGVGVVVSSV